MTHGTIVFDDDPDEPVLVFPVEDVFLADESIKFAFTIPPGIARRFTGAVWRLHDPNGGLVTIGVMASDVGTKCVHDVWTCTLNIHCLNKRTEQAASVCT